LRLDVDLLRLDVDLLRLDVDLLRLDVDLLRLNVDLLRLNVDLLRLNVDQQYNLCPWLTSPSIPLLIKEREARDRMKFCILFNPRS
ncbi:hypothetical protein, partial [Nostoc sp.]|uniref:hypothetical protein n=1 Tax=Nostoc sp. TaxID=1180 RepID=UPI002FFCEB25